MTWTYSEALGTNKDRIRFHIADTLSTDPLLSDEEISAIYTQYGAVYPAAAYCARTIALLFSRRASMITDDMGVSKQYSDRAKWYSDRAAALERQSAAIALPYAGGISVGDKYAQEGDTDRVIPAFRRTRRGDPRLSPALSDEVFEP